MLFFCLLSALRPPMNGEAFAQLLFVSQPGPTSHSRIHVPVFAMIPVHLMSESGGRHISDVNHEKWM